MSNEAKKSTSKSTKETLDQLQQKIEKEKAERAQLCFEEVSKVLKKHNCTLTSEMILRENQPPQFKTLVTPK